MPRPVTQPQRSDLSGEALEAYDAAVARHSPDTPPGEEAELGGYHGALLHSPAYSRLLELGGWTVRTRGEEPGSYSHADREFVDQVLAADMETNCIHRTHIPDGLAVGVRMEAVKALRYGHEEDLTEDEAFLAEFIRATVSGTMTDELWDRMVDRLGLKGTIEYALFCNYLLMTIRNIQVLSGTEPSDEEIDQMIADLESGALELPDASVRIR
jgi:hypothetical protein